MSYSLYVKTNEIWEEVDLGDDVPVMNFQSNDIAELKSRQSDYSQALKLPLSAKNKLIFKNCNSVDTVTNVPYRKHDCRLFSGNYLISGVGSYLIINRISEFFEVQILSGVKDFYSLLNYPMKDVDLGSIIRDYNSVNPVNFTEHYAFAAATFIKGGSPIFQTALANVFPFINIKKAVETLITSKGYTLETNLTNEQWANKYLSLASVASDFPEYKGKATFTGTGTGGYIAYVIDENASGKLTRPGTLTYNPGTLNCAIKIKGSLNGSVSTTCFIQKMDGTTTTDIYSISSTSQNINITVNLLAGEWIKVTALGTSGSTVSSEFIFEVVPMNVPFNEKLPFSYNLGFATQADFFKAILQLFGLTTFVNSETKTVYLYTMDKLYENKSVAKDWSGKLHISKDNINEFSFGGYAQKNYLKFAENSDDNVSDSGVFEIDNTILELTKDLFSLTFQSGMDNYVGENYVANIPLQEITDTDINFKGCPPHIVELSEGTIPFAVDFLNLNYKIATHVTAQTFIDDFYSKFKIMLNPAKVIEAAFKLTDHDIEQFNQFVPVYVQKFGYYFYVNKIINYVSKRLTKVQIIKL